jgi:hypothetical protein
MPESIVVLVNDVPVRVERGSTVAVALWLRKRGDR